MQILKKLTVANLRKNKRRTLVTIIGVMLSSALILAVAGMATSFQAMMINFAKANTGDYHDVYEEVTPDQLALIEQNQHVESYYYSDPLNLEDLSDGMGEYYARYPHEAYLLEDYTALDQRQPDRKEPYNIFVRYDQAKDADEIRERLLNTLLRETGEDINVRINNSLLEYEGAVGETELAAIFSMAAIVIAIIVVTSIFAIRNSFSISATERMRQFGMLASVGATPRQIRQSVLFEGLIIGLIGIPLGILCGILAVIVLVMIVNMLLGDLLAAPVSLSLPFWIFPLALGLSFVTTILSSLMPAIRAGRMSPITAIRGNRDLKIKAKKLKTSRLTAKVFGIGGVIASKNLKRSRKKYRTTVISIVVSVAAFIGLSSFMGLMQKTVDLQYGNVDFDLQVSGGDIDLYQSLIEENQIKDYAYYQSAALSDGTVTLLKVSAAYFEEYAKSLGINTDNYDEVAILNDYEMTLSESGGYKVARATTLKEGDEYAAEIYQADDEGIFATYSEVPENTPTKTLPISITKVTDQSPLGFEGRFYSILLVSENYAQDFPIYESANVLVAKNLDNTTEIVEHLKDLRDQDSRYANIYPLDVEEAMSANRRMTFLIGIFLYGFIIVVTLIGVTNIFNTISTNIALRAKEFAMLKSVGMTSREFNRMVRLESLMYSLKALVIGLPFGILISYGFYRALMGAIDFGFLVPWGAILIAIAAVGVLVSVIMHYSVKQVSRQNIIETIRDDNI